MIKISYQDGQNWIDINGKVRNWDNLAELHKDVSGGQVRVQPNYLAPEIITDSWNGKVSDIQHIRSDAWYLEFWIKESELQEVSRLQSTDTIRVSDLDNGINHIVDKQTAENFQFNEPERIADTSNWTVSFIYRTNKTIINKGVLTPLQTNTLTTSFDDGTTVTNKTFYTDFDVLPTQEDSDLSQFSNESGSNTLSKSTQRNSSEAVFYKTRANANILKKEFERAQTITLNIIPVLENRIVEFTPIGEGLIKLVISCLTEAEVAFPLNV